GSAYLSVFTQEKAPLEKIFQGQKLTLAKDPNEAADSGEAAFLTVGEWAWERDESDKVAEFIARIAPGLAKMAGVRAVKEGDVERLFIKIQAARARAQVERSLQMDIQMDPDGAILRSDQTMKETAPIANMIGRWLYRLFPLGRARAFFQEHRNAVG